jgi:hypothetical protein
MVACPLEGLVRRKQRQGKKWNANHVGACQKEIKHGKELREIWEKPCWPTRLAAENAVFARGLQEHRTVFQNFLSSEAQMATYFEENAGEVA